MVAVGLERRRYFYGEGKSLQVMKIGVDQRREDSGSKKEALSFQSS